MLRANNALNAADAAVAERGARDESLTRPSGPMTHDAHARMMWSLDQAAAASVHATARRATALADAGAAPATWSLRRQELAPIERLHERALTAHRTEVRRAEDRLADELALARHRAGRQCP